MGYCIKQDYKDLVAPNPFSLLSSSHTLPPYFYSDEPKNTELLFQKVQSEEEKNRVNKRLNFGSNGKFEAKRKSLFIDSISYGLAVNLLIQCSLSFFWLASSNLTLLEKNRSFLKFLSKFKKDLRNFNLTNKDKLPFSTILCRLPSSVTEGSKKGRESNAKIFYTYRLTYNPPCKEKHAFDKSEEANMLLLLFFSP